MPKHSDGAVAHALACLELHGGNVKATARELGVPRSTLQTWRDRALAAGPARALALPGTEKRDFAALWGQAQELAIEHCITVAGRLVLDTEPERQAENLRALVGLAHMGAEHALDYSVGRKGTSVQANIDARSVSVFSADDAIRALLEARRQLAEGDG